jgi:hypothetical protein
MSRDQAGANAKFWLSLARRVTWIGFISEIMQACLIFAILAVPVYSFLSAWAASIWLTLLAGWLLLWFLRFKAQHIWHFTLVIIILVASPFVVPGWIGLNWPGFVSTSLSASLLGLAIRAFAQRIRDAEEPSHMMASFQVASMGLFLALDLLASYLGLVSLVSLYFYLAIFYLLLILVRWHSQSLRESLERFSSTPTQPAARVVRFNRQLLLIFSGIMLALLFMAPWLRVHEIVPWFLQQLLNGLRWLVIQLVSLFKSNPAPPVPPTETTPVETLPIGQPQPSPMWLQVLEAVIYYIAQIFVLLLGVALVVIVAVTLYRRFYAGRQSGPDLFESILPKMEDQVRDRVARISHRLQQRFGLEPELRIRRLYGNLIPRLGRFGRLTLDSSLTARQIAGQLPQAEPHILFQITGIYEKARYGNKACSNEDVRQMQRLCHECLTSAARR